MHKTFAFSLLFALIACGGGSGSGGNNADNDNSDDNETVDDTPDVVYVSASHGDDSFDGLSTDSAKGTIAGGIALAVDGTEVRVAQGTYNVPIAIDLKPGVSLLGGYSADFESRDPATNETRIESVAFAFISEDADIDNNTVVDGFSIRATRNSALRVNVDIIAGSPTIQNNRMVGEADDSERYGIRVRGGSPVLANNTITAMDRGIDISGNADAPVVRGNTIADGAGSLPFGIYLGAGKDVLIESNTIYAGDSSGALPFAGIWVAGATVNINNNTVDGGSVGGGSDSKTYGIRVAGGWVGIRNNIIYGGDGAEVSSGVEISGSVWMDNNTIDGGSGSVRASAVSMFQNSEVSMRNNILMAALGAANNYCIYDNNATPDKVLNNNFADCSTTPYFEAEDDCNGNGDGDIDSQTCSISDIQGFGDVTASGNIEEDPSFADIDGEDNDATTLSDNDYHLTDSSPTDVAEGGLDLSVDLADDKDGLSRTASTPNGPSNGGEGWSIGAYEFD